MADLQMPSTPDPEWLGILRLGLAVSGSGLLSYGAWLAWRPAGYLVAGAILLLAGLAGAMRS